MMQERERLLGEYGEWTQRVKELAGREESVWNTPIAEGKWTVRDVVCHIMRWDEYFYDEAIGKISLGEHPTSEHLDYNAFNEEARRYALTLGTGELVDRTIAARIRLIGAIRELPEDAYERTYTDKDGNPFNAGQFMKDFIWHDRHHLRQLEQAALL